MHRTNPTTDGRGVESERERLGRSARLHWFHWLIVILSGVLTLAAWHISKTQLDEKNALQFDREASQAVALVEERMRRYEDALWSGVAAIEASGGDIGYAQWRAFASSLHIDQKYPGISGIGVIRQVSRESMSDFIAEQRRQRPGFTIFPAHNAPELFPIVYIEPEEPNAKAVGLDIAHEANRYEAALNTRDRGVAQITAPIVLVQDSGHTPGFLFYVPFYRSPDPATLELRREAFSGMVYAPFVVKNLMEGTLDKSKRRVAITLADGDEVIYDENQSDEPDYDPEALFTRTVTVNQYGRVWEFNIATTKSFRSDSSSSQPTLILVGGIGIDLLLLTLFVLLTRASRRTLEFADRMTIAIRTQAEALAVSNSDLESFAYVASHDLRTPLRGIIDLSDYLQEDLETYIATADANPDVSRNLQRLKQQTMRMEDLIKGILEYSSVGGGKETTSLIDVNTLLHVQRDELDLREGQLQADGELPVLETYPVRFSQVMSNLIGNAFKYHHDRDHAVVTVKCDAEGDYLRFSVSDNGPGIDPKFHGRIFEVFQTLQSKDTIESTGIGLAIVKKSVEALGGDVTVESVPGTGTTFSFTWPQSIAARRVLEQAVI